MLLTLNKKLIDPIKKYLKHVQMYIHIHVILRGTETEASK